MDPIVIVGDLVYSDLIHRRGAKASQEFTFAEPHPFGVARAAADEMPVAVECHLTARNGGNQAAVYRHLGTVFVRRTGHVQELGSFLDARVGAYPEARGFPDARLKYREESLRDSYGSEERAKVIASGRDAALALAQEAASRARVLDDGVWVPSRAPVIELRVDWEQDAPHLPVNQVTRIAYVTGEPPEGHGSPIRFHIADYEAAAEHVAWSAAHPWLLSRGLSGKLPVPPRIHRMPDRDAFYLATAVDLFEWIRERSSTKGFQALPIPMLEDWLAFRKAAVRAAAGDAAAVAPAYDALCGILDRTPEHPGRDETPEQCLRRTLEEPVRHWRSYLRGMAPERDHEPTPPEDDASLGGLAR